jgi:membrane protease YdiL (CAAX protease family)
MTSGTPTFSAQVAPPSLRTVWWTLALPPVLFLVVFALAGLLVGVQAQGNAQVIAARIPETVPIVLLVVETALLVLVLWALRRDGLSLRAIGWSRGGRPLLGGVIVGIVTGGAIALLYLTVLQPLLALVQRSAGDYVPADSQFPAFGSSLVVYFLANVALAPFAEETLYRGYALTQLRQRFRGGIAALISVASFAFLHWSGGFWYMALVGVAAGIPFTLLCVWQRRLHASFAAHFTLNTLEFLAVALVALR